MDRRRGLMLGRRRRRPSTASLLLSLAVPALTAPSAAAAGFQAGPLEPVKIEMPAGAHTELPPYLLPDHRGLLLSTAWTYRCGLARLGRTAACRSGRLVTFGDSHFFAPGDMPHRPWRRNYQGVFSAELLDGALVQFDQGENKNERLDGASYQNTVQPSVRVADCWEGFVGVAYRHCWPAYSGFVTATMGDGTDLGPVLWPEKGYLWPNGSRASNGLRHPHSIVYRRRVYLFYLDTDWPSGDRAGIRVARAPVAARGRRFAVWHAGAWLPALPRGFAKSRMRRYYARRGPASTPILGLGRHSASFQVARRADGRGFLGVEEWFDRKRRAHLSIRRSADLLKWSRRVDVGVAPEQFDSFPLSYPVFLNASGTANTRVGRSFFVLGTRGTDVYRLPVRMGAP